MNWYTAIFLGMVDLFFLTIMFTPYLDWMYINKK